MRHRRLTFSNRRGQQLVAQLDEPGAGPVHAHALFAHCFTCGKDLKGAYWIARELAARGVGVLRFDFTGLGESEGEFADTNFTSNVDDLVAAAEFMREQVGAPAILIGHSLGGAAVLSAASRIPGARAVVTIGAPSDTQHLESTLLGLAPQLAPQSAGKDDAADVQLGGRTFRIQRQFLQDLADHRVTAAIPQLRRALLVMHSPTDQIVSLDHASRIYAAAKHPKSFVSLDRADHLLSREADARYAASILACWASRYLESGSDRADESAVPGEVLVEAGPSGFANTVSAGKHRLNADEPAHVPGGTDTGPSPYDFLLAALGTCTSMTLRMYADRKKIQLEGVRVKLRHERIHAEDCADCESEQGSVAQIQREIDIRGEMSAEQRARMLEIADRCPVHRTLTSEVKIRTRPWG